MPTSFACILEEQQSCSLVQKDKFYRYHEKIVEHKKDFFTYLHVIMEIAQFQYHTTNSPGLHLPVIIQRIIRQQSL